MTIYLYHSYMAIYFLLILVTKYKLQWALKLYYKFVDKNLVKQEYGLKMCTVKM